MTRNQKIRWVMRKAWQIAKAAVPVHGGKAKEYLGASIRMAWAMLRQGMNIVPTFSAACAVYHRAGESAEVAACEVVTPSEAATIHADDSDVDTIEMFDAQVATVSAKRVTGFFGKIAKVARKVISSVKSILTGSVHIELVTPQME